jgi:hypothetical protein
MLLKQSCVGGTVTETGPCIGEIAAALLKYKENQWPLFSLPSSKLSARSLSQSGAGDNIFIARE